MPIRHTLINSHAATKSDNPFWGEFLESAGTQIFLK